MLMRLPREARLRSGEDIRRIIRRGRRFEAGPYVVRGLPAANPQGSRMAVVVPRRAGRAVARNRIKRCFREAFRLERAGWARDWDLVVYVRSAPGRPTLREAAEVLEGAVGLLEADKKSSPEGTSPC